MTGTDATTLSDRIEAMLVARNHRGMADVREQLAPGYLLRAAQRISASSGRVYHPDRFSGGRFF